MEGWKQPAKEKTSPVEVNAAEEARGVQGESHMMNELEDMESRSRRMEEGEEGRRQRAGSRREGSSLSWRDGGSQMMTPSIRKAWITGS